MSQIPENSSPPSATVEDPDRSADSRIRRRVIAGCVAAALLFVGAVTMLYVKWIHADNPSCLIVVVGEEGLDDATVTVTPLHATHMQPLHAQFKEGFGHRLRFHVPPGVYSVTVRNAANELLFPAWPHMGDLELGPDMKGLVQVRAGSSPATQTASPP